MELQVLLDKVLLSPSDPRPHWEWMQRLQGRSLTTIHKRRHT
jgi:hypothetical protein